MKKFLMAMCFSFLVLSQNCWAQEKPVTADKSEIKRVEVFQCLGVKRMCGDIWLDFDYISSQDSKKLEHVYVLPRNLQVFIHGYEIEESWLSYHKDSKNNDFVDSSAITELWVRNKEIFDLWKNYLVKLRDRLSVNIWLDWCYEKGYTNAVFVDGVGVALVINLKECFFQKIVEGDEIGDDRDHSSLKLVCDVNKISIELKERSVSKDAKGSVNLVVDWGLALARHDQKSMPEIGTHKLIIDSAPCAKIVVESQEDFAKWQKKLYGWKGLSKPHSVLPPK